MITLAYVLLTIPPGRTELRHGKQHARVSQPV